MISKFLTNDCITCSNFVLESQLITETLLKLPTLNSVDRFGYTLQLPEQKSYITYNQTYNNYTQFYNMFKDIKYKYNIIVLNNTMCIDIVNYLQYNDNNNNNIIDYLKQILSNNNYLFLLLHTDINEEYLTIINTYLLNHSMISKNSLLGNTIIKKLNILKDEYLDSIYLLGHLRQQDTNWLEGYKYTKSNLVK